jgi:hypothetical protein
MKWIHNLLKGMSLTAALFVFQACYGTPPGYPEEFYTEEPVETLAEPADDLVPAVAIPAAEEPEAEPEAAE